MLFGLFITLGVAVLSVALRSYQSSISQKVGALGILTASFLAIYYITGNWLLGLISALSWLFLPWLEILTRIRALRLPREKALRPKSPPASDVFPTLDEITAQIENEGFDPEPLMVLYHINLGWPLLAETSRLAGPGRPEEPPEPRDEEARTGLDAWNRFAPPTPNFKERVFYHRPIVGTDGWTQARLENPELGLSFSVTFSPEELPEFVQWTMTGEGTYVLGLEPATCRVEGPAAEEAAGRVIRLQPGETRRHSLDLEVSQ